MSLLSGLNANTGTSTTTMPSWYDTAQQNVIKQAQGIQAPQLGQTVAQGAINSLSGPNNPFAQATGSLNTIASGAANPWIVDPNTGAVTPNTSTAMGGLFAAQQDQLKNSMPGVVAQPDAQSIGGGGFGSLRGMTAADTAMAKATTDLSAQQMAAALQNQQTGTQAASALGNVGQQGINTAMNVGQEQMVAPYANLANYANIIAGVKPGATVSTSQNQSAINQLGGLGSLLKNGTPYADSLLKSLGYSGGLAGLLGPNIPSTSTMSGVPGQDNGTYTDSSGVTYDSMGNPVSQGPAPTDTGSAPNPTDQTGNLPTDLFNNNVSTGSVPDAGTFSYNPPDSYSYGF